jgi:DNA-directed RNA polymerase specialized sigma24 family protein
MHDIVTQRVGKRRDVYERGTQSDYREELIQDCWVSVLACQQRYPVKAGNAQYLKRVILNTVFKAEQKSRPRRDRTDSLQDDQFNEIPTQIDESEFARQDIVKLTEHLTDTELVVVELAYGFGRGEETGPCGVPRICRLLERSNTWVTSRLMAARIKMRARAEK